MQNSSGRPPIPADLHALIRRIARDNPSWSEERLANELLLTLGLRVSPRTVRKYMPKRPAPGRHQRIPSQRLRIFVRNHANVTAHPTAHRTLQQLREADPSDNAYRVLIHDRDSVYSRQLAQSVRNLGLQVLKAPVRSPQANALCERLLDTLRRECPDFLIPLSEHHLQRLLKEWVHHYHTGRPHMALGPCIPQPPPQLPARLQAYRHRIPEHLRVVTRLILGGLYHEFWLQEKTA